MLAGVAEALRPFLCRRDLVLAEALQLSSVSHDQRRGPACVHEPLGEATLESGKALVHLLQLLLDRVVKAGATRSELLFVVLHEAQVLASKTGTLVVYGPDAALQGAVEVNPVRVGGELWCVGLLELLHLWAHVCARKQRPALLECHNGVLEGGRVGVGLDRLDPRHLLRHALLEGGRVVLHLHPVKGWVFWCGRRLC
nr:unnamed protein product [Leishmania braziliensis]